MSDDKKTNDPAVQKPKKTSEENAKEEDLKEVAGGLTSSEFVPGDGLVSCC